MFVLTNVSELIFCMFVLANDCPYWMLIDWRACWSFLYLLIQSCVRLFVCSGIRFIPSFSQTRWAILPTRFIPTHIIPATRSSIRLLLPLPLSFVIFFAFRSLVNALLGCYQFLWRGWSLHLLSLSLSLSLFILHSFSSMVLFACNHLFALNILCLMFILLILSLFYFVCLSRTSIRINHCSSSS